MKNAAVQEEVCRVRKANEKMQQEIEELSNSKLESLQEQRGLLMKDLEKFRLLIDSLHKHHQDVAGKLSDAKNEAASKGILAPHSESSVIENTKIINCSLRSSTFMHIIENA